jgi:hypothetical protein
MIITDNSTLTGRQYSHGRYLIRTQWRGRSLVYDIVTHGGLIVSSGFDMTGSCEELIIEGIKQRLGGSQKENQNGV